MVINGVLAAVGTVYLATESLAVTIIGAVIALALAVLHRLTQS